MFAVSSAEKLEGILIRFSIRFLRDSRLLKRAPILEFDKPLYLFTLRASLVVATVKSKLSVGSCIVVVETSSVSLGASSPIVVVVVVSSGTAVDPAKSVSCAMNLTITIPEPPLPP